MDVRARLTLTALDCGYVPEVALSTHDQALLGIYLNDQMAASVAGSNLARRLAASERESAKADVLERLATEFAEDRAALQDVMEALDVPVRHPETWAAWTAERMGRLKLNGRLVRRSPLSRVLELEAMRLGVEGKAAGWRMLRAGAATDDHVDADRLDALIERARAQIDLLEQLRVDAAAEVFGGRSTNQHPSRINLGDGEDQA